MIFKGKTLTDTTDFRFRASIRIMFIIPKIEWFVYPLAAFGLLLDFFMIVCYVEHCHICRDQMSVSPVAPDS